MKTRRTFLRKVSAAAATLAIGNCPSLSLLSTVTEPLQAAELPTETWALGGPVILKPQQDKTTAVDVGRQLFVDDFLIESTTLSRQFHYAKLYEGNPILKPETPDEIGNGEHPVAAPFDGGAWYDPQDSLFKLWYMAGMWDGNCYAVSKDGLRWERPRLDVVPGSNRVLPVRKINGSTLQRDAATVWLDYNAEDASERYKMAMYSRLHGKTEKEAVGQLFTSPDGIHWKTLDVPLGWRNPGWYGGDNTSFYYDPFRKLWVHSIRELAHSPNGERVSARFYFSGPDFVRSFTECTQEAAFPAGKGPWLAADALDQPDVAGFQPQLGDFTAVAYEGLMLGVFPIRAAPSSKGTPNVWDLKLGFSRDGYHFERPDHHPFLASSRIPGTWNGAYLHPVGGVCMVVGDQLYFYFSGWSGITQTSATDNHAGGSTALALLRRDGFASMDAAGNRGFLTTTPISFKGKYPFVNADAKGGKLLVEVLDKDGKVIAPFSADRCVPVKTDSTCRRIKWRNGADLSSLAGKPVRFKFELTNGQLYSFWVSPDASGASYGYVAAGGPGFSGPTDTIGEKTT